MGCPPARGGAAAQSLWAVRDAGKAVTRSDKCVPGAGRCSEPHRDGGVPVHVRSPEHVTWRPWSAMRVGR